MHGLAGYTVAFRDLGPWHAIHGFQYGPACLPGHVQRPNMRESVTHLGNYYAAHQAEPDNICRDPLVPDLH